jgi:hypothetical protein
MKLYDLPTDSVFLTIRAMDEPRKHSITEMLVFSPSDLLFTSGSFSFGQFILKRLTNRNFEGCKKNK